MHPSAPGPSRLETSISEFGEAAQWVSSLLSGLHAPDWHGPGIGDWDLRALAGHTSRALLTVEQYLGRPSAVEEIASPAEYFRRTSAAAAADPGEVHKRGVAAGEALGEDPASAFAEIVERVTERVGASGDPLVECIVGGIRLSGYLPTRTFELVVHGIDIARATGQDPEPPRAALSRAAALAADLAVQGGDGVLLLEALTGRGSLGPGLTVL